ncbi:restriction endonuclease subunit S [Autumnicola edwardsiae]|uniref:Restriction endonuclease subunit S n=1 Tax=Autumnicola edwardsiae TaxID=3075594 RepID=A0ABU3CZE0_9FLAO|nr:restriction endonuclease subunit S [Zunongwangia sp. F297]MDT0651740.1 restriction endonuclease subunit S [Zunongwangia sp. F297]
MNSWYRLGDYVVDSLKGITPKYVDESDIIVLNQKCIRNNSIDYKFSRFHDGNKKFSEKKILRIGDILFNSTGQGTAGRCCFVRDLPKDETVITDSHILILRIEDFYLAESFSYSFYNEELFIQTFMDGSTGQGELDKLRLFNVEFKLPEKLKRKGICEFLGVLNEKIEVNQKINQQLEAMAKLVYDFWFVQFDFPMSKAYAASIGKPRLAGKPYKASSGKMVYNAELKREIPKGWEDGTLSDIAEITMGQSPAGSSYNQEEIGTVFYQGSTDFGLRFPAVRQYTTEPSRMAQEGDILLSVRAPVGTINQAMEDCCIGRGLAALREKKGSISYLWSQMVYFKQIFDRKNASGTTFGAITKNELFGLKVCIPNEQVLDDFKEIVDPLHDKIIVCSKENQRLAELRDWLLPMLMNGQVGIKEAYKEVDNEFNIAAEDNEGYRKNSNFVDSLFENLNFYKEIAAVQLIEEETTGRTHGKTGIQKTMSNLQQILKEERLEKVKFKERPWGMFSDTIAENIETNPFIYKFKLENGRKVYRVKPEAKKELQNWINLNENRSYITSLNQILSIHQEPFINNDIYKMELLNTVYRCMSKLESDDLGIIREAMKDWPMIEPKYKNKAEKFSEKVTAKMMDFIKKNQLI